MKNIEKYLSHIESVCGGQGRYYRITDDDEKSLVAVPSYENMPEPGCLTAFSYGLSSAGHTEWVNSRPELVISVNSTDQAWAIALGELIRNGRDKCLFSYGTVLNFGQKISDTSDMTSFLVFACTVLDENDKRVNLNDYRVQLSQIYPIHQSEVALIKEIGIERFFFELKIDFFDVQRKQVWQPKK